MIEVEHDKIRFSAIDAGMLGEIREHARAVGRADALPLGVNIGDVTFAIALIPGLLVNALARLAPSLPELMLSVLEAEFADRLGKSTTRAGLGVHRSSIAKSARREKVYFFAGGKNVAKSAGSTSASCSSGNSTTPASRNARATNSAQEYLPSGS